MDTIKAMKKTADTTINGLASRCTNVGTLTATHMVHPLCFLQLAPMYLLSFAVVSPTANQFKKEKISSSMRLYIESNQKGEDSDDIDGKKKTKSGKNNKLPVLLSSMTRFLRVLCKNAYLSEGTAENILCEATRSSVTFALFIPGHWFYRELPCDVKNKCVREWVPIVPVVDDSGKLSYRKDEFVDPMALFEDEVSEINNQKEMMSTAIWGANSNPLPGCTLERRDDNAECTHIEFVIKSSD
jgi:hypothetical protein